MLVSIILPSYNVQPYLELCVKSIIASGLSSDVFEIIIIDDGSTDGTGIIGEKLCSSYPNIFYYNQPNRGVSAARNVGLILAKNRYIWFIDPDDLIKSDLILDMVYMIVENNLDAIGMNHYYIEEDGTQFKKDIGLLDSNGKHIISGAEFYFLNYKHTYIWQYIFRKEIFNSNNIKFREDMVMEDSEILPKLMANIHRIRVFDNPVYANRRRVTSLLKTKGLDSEINFMNSIIKLAESLNDQVKKYSTYRGLATGLSKKAQQVNQILFLQFIEGDWSKQQKIRFVNEMKSRGVFPFSKITDFTIIKNLRFNAWRHMVNMQPFLFSTFYKKIN